VDRRPSEDDCIDGTARTRVLLVDDHALLRLALRDELETAGFEICGEAGDGASALELAEQSRPDVCVLDLYMPAASDGLSLAREIGSRVPETAVVVLSASWLKVDVDEALAAGARGYLLKDDDPRDLPHQLSAICDGRQVVSAGATHP
jgi:DNA-binding NarL/FixJ family response regulator